MAAASSRRIEHDGGRNLIIRFPFHRTLVDLVKSLPHRRWHGDQKYWSAPVEDVVAVVETMVPHGFQCDDGTAHLYGEKAPSPIPLATEPAAFGGQPGLFDSPPSQPAAASEENEDYTVERLNLEAAAALRRAFPSSVWLTGEISGFNKSAHRKHVGFKLVEHDEGGGETAQVNAILFAGVRETIEEKLHGAGDPFKLEDEISVRLLVAVEIYEAWGQYRVRVDDIDVGYTLGEAARRREEIIRKLTAEGLLEQNSSLPMPVLPLRVGLITSLGSDAFNDVKRTLEESGFGFQVTAHGARVQGRSTESSVLNALDWFRERMEQFDVVLICRGGGSRTDLAWFDNEKLGRAVAEFPLPVLSGIGHEQDFSVLDALARSAKTPTAAAMFLVERVGVALQAVEEAGGSILNVAAEILVEAAARDRERAGRLARATRNLLAHAGGDAVHRGRRLAVGTRNRLTGARSDLHRLLLGIPKAAAVRFAGCRTDLERARGQIGPTVRRLLALAAERTDGRQSRLSLSDPARVVERGFAVLRSKAGQAIRHPDEAPQGTELTAQLRGGRLGLRSTGKEE